MPKTASKTWFRTALLGFFLAALAGIVLRYAFVVEIPIDYMKFRHAHGHMVMVLLSVLPVGLAQTWVSVKEGLWYARSAAFMDLPVINTFKWLRVIGDTIFAVGILVLVWFVIGIKTGWSVEKELEKPPEG